MSTTIGTFTPPPPSPPSPPPEPTPPVGDRTTLRTFRDAIREISPWWLRGPRAGSVLYAIAAQLDLLTDAARAGVKARFPGRYSFESLPLIGRERRIRRGRTEADETYAARLMRWIDDHRFRGGPYAMLAQLRAFYSSAFEIELKYASGRRYVLATDGTIVRSDVAWSPPGVGGPERWARWWLTYAWPTPVDNDGTWADEGEWDDGGVWDSNLSPEDVRDIRLVPREWNAAHAMGMIVIVSPLETVLVSAEGS